MTRKQALKWWKEARFGLFIHWGIYSLLERGEWVMYNERIPVKEYEKLAARFNPVKFNADEWVKLAKDAGMKYIVITAKHHDGFSMFKTKVSDFNIVDATPYGRDVMAELAEACRKEDIRLGFYYSHVREWRDPRAQSYEAQGRVDRWGNYGNFWDYPNENLKDLQEYIDEFDVPQLKELLTQYGDVLTIWFDTPSHIRPLQGEQLKKVVRGAQAACLVNSRLSYDIETDYASMGDNEIPAAGSDEPWETAMTTMDSWGFHRGVPFGRWEDMLERLIDVTSKGGNFLLNVGPDSEGVIPADAQKSLLKIGAWLKKYGKAIYGTERSPFPAAPEWGRVTAKGKKLYLIVTDPLTPSITLNGLRTNVVRCKALENGKALPMEQIHDAAHDRHRLTVKLPGLAEKYRVVQLELEGAAEVADRLEPDGTGQIILPAARAEIMNVSGANGLKVGASGVTEGWTDPRDQLCWTFFTEKAGMYSIEIVIKTGFWKLMDWGHEINVELDDRLFGLTLADAGGGMERYGERKVRVTDAWLEAGRHALTIAPEVLTSASLAGLTITRVTLRSAE